MKHKLVCVQALASMLLKSVHGKAGLMAGTAEMSVLEL